MNKIWSKIKNNSALAGLIAVALIGFLYMFFKKGGDMEEYEKFRKTVENLKTNRDKEQGKIESIENETNELEIELDEVREERNELETRIAENANTTSDARNRLEEFLRTHGG